MLKISAVLIAKNEEAMLPRCLESIKGVDEIIVCDTGSTDNTVEVAKKFTDKVFTDFTWCDDFSKARNHALSKATGDWILSIDADEYCVDFKEIKRVIEEAEKRGELAVNVIMCAEEGGQRFVFPRIFKKCPQVWWEGAIHNHLSVVGAEIGNVEIVHGYSPAHQLDPDRALRILKKEVEEKGNGREMYYLGREHWYKGNLEEAIKTLGKYVQITKFLAEKADAFLIMARCYWFLKMPDDARQACVSAIIINPNFKEAIMFMSELVWEHHSSQWKKMAETANNTEVLFVRPC